MCNRMNHSEVLRRQHQANVGTGADLHSREIFDRCLQRRYDRALHKPDNFGDVAHRGIQHRALRRQSALK